MKIKEIAEYMRKNIEKSCTVEGTAREFGYSKFEFSKKFKKKTGFLPSHFLSFLKIEKALEIIINENENIITAQIRTGYNSSGTFSNIFKKYTGISPSNYKKTIKKFYKTIKNYINSSEVTEISYNKALKINKAKNFLYVNLIYPENYESEITFIGLFKNCIPDDLPDFGKILISSKAENRSIFENIPEGKYWLMGFSIEKGSALKDFFYLGNSIRARRNKAIVFPTDKEYTLKFRKPIPSDFPFLINFYLVLFIFNCDFLLSEKTFKTNIVVKITIIKTTT